jgi:demethylmenaquinone methyltransferase/2-methoxy-6-polyprenyl-1,4-benzoquinol methylase
MDDDVEALVAEQVAYYRAHAPDYDNYLGKDWDHSIEELPISGDVLELACGTGHWTRLLGARSVIAVDAAPEVLALARRRVRGLPVEFIQADVLAWQPPRRFDTVFFAFWLTHVPRPGSPTSGRWSGWPWQRTGGSALLTTATRHARANVSCLTRQRRPSGAGFATAASTGWCTTGRVRWRPGWLSWAGRQRSTRTAPRCLSEPPEGPSDL